MMAKTIEGIFNPRSLKMRHEVFKTQGAGGGGSLVGGAGAARGINGGVVDGSQQQGVAATVSEKTRDDVQKIFMNVLRDVRDRLTFFAPARAHLSKQKQKTKQNVSALKKHAQQF